MKLILDTPVLLLYMVGIYDSDYISSFKRTHQYSKEDFVQVSNIVDSAKELYLTPQILAELSNMSFEIPGGRLKKYLLNLIKNLSGCKEGYVKMQKLLTKPNLIIKVGFTDLSIIELSKKEKCTILTDDFRFNGIAVASGCKSYNFTQIRGLSWFDIYPLRLQ